ncbi:hypothetical protein FGO68_gene13544 [Halteria grandinella]|uniref:Uncharacterized protein n=1 Tax=Halteria grandinella TaxID=5974 RepID=A0A8J8NAA7_HALGN|nr:hypothetical protein FGO68_gene13544 [Halteria grandinella]
MLGFIIYRVCPTFPILVSPLAILDSFLYHTKGAITVRYFGGQSSMFANSENSCFEELLPPHEIAALLPSRIRGRKVSAATIRRWQQAGLRNGQVYLNSRKVGSIRCSTRADLKRFFDELTAADEADRHQFVEQPKLSPTKSARADDRRYEHYDKIADERRF